MTWEKVIIFETYFLKCVESKGFQIESIILGA